ncbi:hypothetical protein SNEBB_002885 [Seison nebaliae]|nr:hypothetical protein SNEBB_002885 [Seison nebaliae]
MVGRKVKVDRLIRKLSESESESEIDIPKKLLKLNEELEKDKNDEVLPNIKYDPKISKEQFDKDKDLNRMIVSFGSYIKTFEETWKVIENHKLGMINCFIYVLRRKMLIKNTQMNESMLRNLSFLYRMFEAITRYNLENEDIKIIELFIKEFEKIQMEILANRKKSKDGSYLGASIIQYSFFFLSTLPIIKKWEYSKIVKDFITTTFSTLITWELTSVTCQTTSYCNMNQDGFSNLILHLIILHFNTLSWGESLKKKILEKSNLSVFYNYVNHGKMFNSSFIQHNPLAYLINLKNGNSGQSPKNSIFQLIQIFDYLPEDLKLTFFKYCLNTNEEYKMKKAHLLIYGSLMDERPIFKKIFIQSPPTLFKKAIYEEICKKNFLLFSDYVFAAQIKTDCKFWLENRENDSYYSDVSYKIIRNLSMKSKSFDMVRLVPLKFMDAQFILSIINVFGMNLDQLYATHHSLLIHIRPSKVCMKNMNILREEYCQLPPVKFKYDVNIKNLVNCIFDTFIILIYNWMKSRKNDNDELMEMYEKEMLDISYYDLFLTIMFDKIPKLEMNYRLLPNRSNTSLTSIIFDALRSLVLGIFPIRIREKIDFNKLLNIRSIHQQHLKKCVQKIMKDNSKFTINEIDNDGNEDDPSEVVGSFLSLMVKQKKYNRNRQKLYSTVCAQQTEIDMNFYEKIVKNVLEYSDLTAYPCIYQKFLIYYYRHNGKLNKHECIRNQIGFVMKREEYEEFMSNLNELLFLKIDEKVKAKFYSHYMHLVKEMMTLYPETINHLGRELQLFFLKLLGHNMKIIKSETKNKMELIGGNLKLITDDILNVLMEFREIIRNEKINFLQRKLINNGLEIKPIENYITDFINKTSSLIPKDPDAKNISKEYVNSFTKKNLKNYFNNDVLDTNKLVFNKE